MQRDYFIDWIKGIAIINVIIIHTVYNSGGQFPHFLQNLVLLVDVPLFFLCSGITSSGNIKRSINRLFKTQISYILYILILFLISILLKYEPSHTLILNSIYHNHELIPPFLCAYQSLWFLVIFILVSFFGSIILTLTQNKKIIDFILIILILIVLYTNFIENIFLDITCKTIFYLFIFLLGYRLKNIRLSNIHLLAGIAIAGAILYFWFSAPHFPLIAVYKFPPHIIYLTASSFSILITLFLRTRIKIKPNNVFIYPGRESLFFYFGQGITITITTSLIILFVKHSVKWYLVFLIGSIVNIAITYVIAIILKYLDTLMWKGLDKIPIKRIKNLI